MKQNKYEIDMCNGTIMDKLISFSVPLMLSGILQLMFNAVDIIVVGRFAGSQSLAAVGSTTALINMFVNLFIGVSLGANVLAARFYASGKHKEMSETVHTAITFAAISGVVMALIGVLMSVILAFFSGGILRMVSIAPALLEPAETYLRIVGGACFLNALIPIFSSYLRVFGYTKHSLIGTVVGNAVNIILNSVFLFVFNWGVMGVAVATVISRIVNLIIVAVMGAVLIKAKQNPERIPAGRILAQIVRIGFPSALETALYNVAMTLIVRFMNQMDSDGMNVTARSYAMQIANFSYCVGAALAQANAIMTGWRIGAKEYEECDRGTRKAVIYGLITAACFSVTFALSGRFIVHIFTDDTQMVNLVVKLLVVDIFLE